MTRAPLNEGLMRSLAMTAAREAGVPDWLVLAVARHESGGFYPDARRGEAHLGDSSHGLMQLLLATAKENGFTGAVGAWNNTTRTGTGLYDPLTNLRLGARHLAKLLKATNGDLERAVSAYNTGLGNAKRAQVVSRFCEIWKPTAPKVGRNLDRDCEKIRTVQVGEWPNQPYVNAIERLAKQYGGSLKPVAVVSPDTAGSGGVSRPAGGTSVPSGTPSSPSPGGTVFVVRSTLLIALAALGTVAYLALRR